MSNLWERQQNQRAKVKKERAKQKSIGPAEEEVEEGWVREADETQTLLRVVGVSRRGFQIKTDEGIRESRLAPGVSPRCAKDLAVGDWVVAEEGGEQLHIRSRTPRHGVVARMRGELKQAMVEEHVLAANVDIGVVVSAIKQPIFYAHFIDRYLAILEYGHVKPIICLTKTDLGDERHPILDFYKQMAIPVVESSSKAGKGLEDLKALIRGKTVVFLGQSGVGKSSLVNLITNGETAKTGEVSDRTGEGMHTTTGSSLYEWEPGSFIIDTPGIRTVGTDHLEREQIRFLFPEFEKFNNECKFSSCLHLNEPGCAVKEALERRDPALNQYRFESYLKMMSEEAEF